MAFDPKPARLAAAFLAPYLSSALWNLDFRAVKNAQFPLKGTMGVDKHYRCYYDADIAWTAEQGAAVLVHEVGHLLRAHHARADQIMDLQAVPWLLSSDAALNADLVDDPKLQGKFPFDVVLPETFKLERGHTAEWYYSALVEQAQQSCTCGGQGKKGKNGQQQGQGQGQQNQPQNGQQQGGQGGQKPGDQQGRGSGQGDPNCPIHGHHDCGSCAGGPPRDYEVGAPSKENPGVTEAQGELIRRQVAEDIKKYESDPSHSRGTVPGGWLRWADEILSGKIHWSAVLPVMIRRARMSAMQRVDYAYTRPSRRSHDMGFILPRLLGPDVSLGVVIDTSGSVGKAGLTQAVAEIAGMLKQYRDVTVYSVDADVHASKKLTGDVRKLLLYGGGGTDMMLGIHHAADKRHHAIICITDGLCPFDDAGPPGVPVILCIIDNPDFLAPAWAKTLLIDSSEDPYAHAA